jgi:hypothetical protein
VFYRGFREGKGIWGTWEITIQYHGGFHIWPRQAGEGEARTASLAADETLDALDKQELASGSAWEHKPPSPEVPPGGSPLFL